MTKDIIMQSKVIDWLVACINLNTDMHQIKKHVCTEYYFSLEADQDSNQDGGVIT